ncbi:HK97 family phage prohead protease [Flammeovirga sp. OC4]|uniref:HK97 family phage prohead protease n=1 Tax=Flammeovirga sp. OC4 TaxID=1382345 RepID=UPI0006936F44|nr:HK97 family phage prohead protease [Flammeovirga sp. OC4]
MSKKKHTFVINDESKVNSHGFRLMNAGIDQTRFKTNPVLLYNHGRDDVYGKWENLRIEGTQLLADAVFDEDDLKAKALSGKVERGFLKGASPMLQVIEVDLDPAGEFMATKSDLMEISVVSIPSNANALKLMNTEGNEISFDEVCLQLDFKKVEPKNKKMKIKLSVALQNALGLSAEVDETDFVTAVEKELTAYAALKLTVDAEKDARAVALVELAIKEGKINAEAKEQWLSLAKDNIALAESTLNSLEKKQSLSAQITQGGTQTTGGERATWTYLQWAQKDPQGLAKLKLENPQAFEQLKNNK